MICKSLTSGVLGAGSDLACQSLAYSTSTVDGGIIDRSSFDVERTARMGCWGLLVSGPIGHVWYMLLDRAVRAAGVRGVVTKVLLDQMIATPPLIMAFFAWNTF